MRKTVGRAPGQRELGNREAGPAELGASCCSPGRAGHQSGVTPDLAGRGGGSSSRCCHIVLLLLLHRYNHLMSAWTDLRVRHPVSVTAVTPFGSLPPRRALWPLSLPPASFTSSSPYPSVWQLVAQALEGGFRGLPPPSRPARTVAARMGGAQRYGSKVPEVIALVTT